MRLTLRGVAVLVVVGLAMLAGFLSGERSLNAVAAPLLGAVLFGAVQLWRTGEPTVTVEPVPPGYPGAERTLSISFEGSGVVRAASDWPTGIEGDPVDAVLALPTTLTADVRLTERGVHALGGLTVSRRDALGLVEAPVALAEPTSVVVYPAVYRVARPEALGSLLADDHHIERQEFDRLREYQPGDPLRRVHWKSSAKHDDFLVVEFSPDSRTEQVTIAADAVEGQADAMATAVGTIALLVLRAGLDVGLRLPDEDLPAGSGEAHRANLLSMLARADAGTVGEDRRDAADVVVEADHRVTRLRVGSSRLTFAELVDGSDASPVREVALA